MHLTFEDGGLKRLMAVCGVSITQLRVVSRLLGGCQLHRIACFDELVGVNAWFSHERGVGGVVLLGNGLSSDDLEDCD